MRDYQKVFLKAAFNSLLPEFMDSDTMDLNGQVSPEFIGSMRKVLDYYYGSDAITEQRKKDHPEYVRMLEAGAVNYDMVNDFFKTSSFYKTYEYDGVATDVKLILGRFQVRRNDDGSYDINDIYDFGSNGNYIRTFAPEVKATMVEYGLDGATADSIINSHLGSLTFGISASVGKQAVHPTARMLGGILMPDSELPETSGGQYVKLHIPRDDIVKEDSPAPRPTWFEDDNIEPVFPATPMDEERESLFTKAINLIFPPAQAGQLDKDFEKNMMDLGIVTPSELEAMRSNRPDEYQQLYNRYLQNMEVPPSKTSKMSLPTSKPGVQMATPTSKPGVEMATPTSKPTTRERRVASAQDQDFSDASA